MRTVVQVSPAEVVRMVATLVMQRPENLGKCTSCIEMHNGPQGITEIRVVMFDTPEEAHAAAPKPPKASVLTLVAGGGPTPAPPADVPGAP